MKKSSEQEQSGHMRKLKIEFLLLMCAYGCLGPVVRGISLPSLVIVWARAVISAAALLIFLLLFRREGLKDCRAFLGPMVFSGIFLAVDWIGLFASYRYTTIATTTLCYYIAPVLVLLGAAVFLREKLSLRQVICIAVAVVGMGFVSGMVQNGLPKLSEMKGVLLALLGAFGYAVVILINKRYPEGDQLKRTLIQLCTAALIMTVYVLGTTDLSVYSPGVKDIGLLLLLGVVMTAAAYIAYFGLVVRIPSGSVAFFSYADPVVAVIISVFFLGEPFSIYTFIGAVMIIGAAIVAEGGFKKK